MKKRKIKERMERKENRKRKQKQNDGRLENQKRNRIEINEKIPEKDVWKNGIKGEYGRKKNIYNNKMYGK